MPTLKRRVGKSAGRIPKEGGRAVGQPAATKRPGNTLEPRGQGERRDTPTDFGGGASKWGEFDHGLAGSA